MMQSMTQTARDGALLRDLAYVGLRDADDSFWRGLQIMVAISLIVGLVLSLVGFIQQVTAPPPDVQIEATRQQMQQMFSQFRAFGPPFNDPQFQRQFQANLEAGFRMGAQIAEATIRSTPVGGPVQDLFQAIGRWASYPFNWISTWMWYTLLVLVFAKLMGGTATVQEMLGTTSLIAVPHLLDLFGFIPVVGGVLGLVAFFWGLVVYVKATAVANRFGIEKGLAAVLLPVVVLILLVVLLAMMLIVLIVATSRGS